MLQLSEIWIYPIKSLGGISMNQSKVTQRGLENDRRWMLVDEEGLFITQRKHPELVLFQTQIEGDFLKIVHKRVESDVLKISLSADDAKTKRKFPVTVWEDVVEAQEVSAEANIWFSERLGFEVKLVHMPDESLRKVDPEFAVTTDDITSFSDGFPFLIIGQASLDDLNSRLENAVNIKRFRPNFVFTGGQAYEEESWQAFSIGNLNFFGVKPCGRCIITTVNPEIGVFEGKEPLRTLSHYRKVGNKVLFGQNVIAKNQGVLRCGDLIKVGENYYE